MIAQDTESTRSRAWRAACSAVPVMLPSEVMQRAARVIYDVPRSRSDWELSEEPMSESVPHAAVAKILEDVLSFWASSKGDVQIARNLAIRWDSARPKVGVDPDVCVVTPKPPDAENLTSLRTWLPGHAPPKLAIEVVSESNAAKDYTQAPDKYAASGTEELWIFDPLLVGPRAHGGPLRLQVWRRVDGAFAREYAGEGPAWSTALGAWAVVTDEGRFLRVAANASGAGAWPTEAENLRATLREMQAQLAKGSG